MSQNHKKIWLSSPHMGEKERNYLLDSFDSNWIAPLGPYVDRFEQQLSQKLHDYSVAALSSGTAALHLSLILLGVERGDFVICQSMTFSASANPIRYMGAVPVFVDSEPDTWNMDPGCLQEAIAFCLNKGRKPKAIVVVDLYGMPANMEAILAIAREYEIPVVEDAAEALGSRLNEQACGTFGDFSILSFNGNKIITTSGGGALVAKDAAAIARSRYLATQAREPAPHYEHTVVGYNYRLSNICAAIGCGQLEALDQRVAARRANHQFYEDALASLPGISFLKEPAGYFSNRWLSCILVDPVKTGGIDREQIRLALEKYNIESRPLWKPMHLQPVFSDAPFIGGAVSENLFATGLCLPSGSNLSLEEKEVVATLIIELFKERKPNKTNKLTHEKA